MAAWTRQNTESFINLYRSFDCLWKVKSKDYFNKLVKDKAYSELLEFTRQNINPDADKDYVIKKISNLRTCVRKEFKKVERSKTSGAAADDVYAPNLWYYPLLH